MTKYRAFYPSVEPELVLAADPKAFPLRATVGEAVRDVQDAWHKGHPHGHALHLTLYEIDGETVTEREVRIQRRTVVV